MSGSATPDFNSDGVADIFSAATGTLTVWNSEGGNKFGPATAISSGTSSLLVWQRPPAHRTPTGLAHHTGHPPPPPRRRPVGGLDVRPTIDAALTAFAKLKGWPVRSCGRLRPRRCTGQEGGTFPST
ncbi:FG-GAP repeat domain-containing protein [Nonomuraea basaltis]|uniref:FG-GAP repeat domain-containing protein n=1 Tax=Nonomuraea basaltis TaxID=2495887 RepID=UPI00110C695B|nr:VCBS repeat-containing protein [Nonomuraea basaltis]TMR97159.1 VCBS repeat-containing protein [Nonomuraea basaltis]